MSMALGPGPDGSSLTATEVRKTLWFWLYHLYGNRNRFREILGIVLCSYKS